MKQRLLFLIFILYVLSHFVACTGCAKKTDMLADLEEAPLANMEEFLCLDSIGAFGVTDFAVKDSLLWLLLQRPASEDVLACCSLADHALKSVIKRGRGPGEMITVTSLDACGAIVAADCNANVMATVEGDAVAFRQLPAGRLVTCITDGRRVISTGAYAEGRYRLVNLESGRIGYFGDYPQGDRPIGKEYLPTAYINTELAMKPDRTRFVSVNSNSGILEILSIEGDSLAPIARVAYHYPQIAETSVGKMRVAAIRKDNVNGFFDVTCSNDRIYAIYSGKTYNEAGLGLDLCDYLIQFDWSGNLIESLRLSPSLGAVQFDSGSNTLFGLAHTPSRSFIYRLNLEGS